MSRYIDADAVLREASKRFDYVDDFEEVLDAIPTADVRENVKGEWIEMGTNTDGTHNIKCSECGGGYKTTGHARSLVTKVKYKFCPHCGADMRGADNAE